MPPANNQRQNPTVVLNARGRVYEILLHKLEQFPASSRLGKLRNFVIMEPDELLEVCDNYNLNSNEFYFDRDADILGRILNFQCTGKLHFDENVCIFFLRNELNYWGFNEEHLDLCCRFTNNLKHSTMSCFDTKSDDKLDLNNSKCKEKWLGALRIELLDITEKPDSSLMAKVILFYFDNQNKIG